MKTFAALENSEESLPPRRAMRWVLVTIIGTLVILLGYVIFTFSQVWLYSHTKSIRKTGAIVIMGAAEFDGRPSKVLKARLETASQLYRDHISNLIVVTGGSKPGDTYSEAGVGKTYLAAGGVPSASVIAVSAGDDSYASVKAASKVLKAQGVTSATFVSDPFHLFRVVSIATSLGIAGQAYGDVHSPIRGFLSLEYMLRETIAVSAGRVVGFAELSNLRHGS